ncbi:hypothetical protein [Ottowia thiooxydans]|uniref:hypothetical protein n=1 Tax=Ottowia thiooxydans TaxID=219182 RepID=UPI00041756FC|nr:hypothetical protein [Ottowia thiooxydans]
MIYKGTAERARQTRRRLQITGMKPYHKSEWMDTGRDGQSSPTVFLVEMDPDSTVNPHFHRNNQFQLFLTGNGSIGKQKLSPVTVHYAGAFTGYGPLVAGPEGLGYFTMRPVYEQGALLMPENRDKMVRGPKRMVTSESLPATDPAYLENLTQIETSEPIPLQPDKLAASITRLPAGMSITGRSPGGSGGQFYVVLAGSMVHDGVEMLDWEHIFVTEDEAPYTVTAGLNGLEVLCLQYPPRAEEYKVPEAMVLCDDAALGVPVTT